MRSASEIERHNGHEDGTHPDGYRFGPSSEHNLRLIRSHDAGSIQVTEDLPIEIVSGAAWLPGRAPAL
jgi:hypothetical protein